MSRRSLISLIALVALLVTGCGVGSNGTGSVLLSPPEAEVDRSETWEFPSCNEVPRVIAPAEAYRDEPIYVANEMPVDEVRSWASRQPGFEGIWIDRDHNGWVTVAFSQDAEQRQADLEREFPGVGVVAVGVGYRMSDLLALQSRVHSELGSTLGSVSSWVSEDMGVVGLMVGVLTDEIRTELTARYAGSPLCVDALDPSTLPAPGPQAQSGDGWVLLANEPQVGFPYRTGIATDQESLRRLWETIGLESAIPEVDFQTHVVIWFGAVFSSGCPGLRLDDVIVDGSTVHALVVLPTAVVACNADANPHAFVVALERWRLPVGPFIIQLDENGPPPGAPEERTVVDADLSRPGAVAGPDQIGSDPNLPEPPVIESGAVVEPGYPQAYRLYVHCGIEWLGELNDVNWQTSQVMPAEWASLVSETETIVVDVTLQVEPEPRVRAEANGATVIYQPTSESIPGCD